MKSSGKRFSIGKKMFIFILTTVLLAVAGICFLSYKINIDQIDKYYKRLTINSADNYAAFVDTDFIRELRAVAESDEYQDT